MMIMIMTLRKLAYGQNSTFFMFYHDIPVNLLRAKILILPSSAQTSTQLQFEADLALFSFYPPPTHHPPTTHPSGQVVTLTH